MFKEPKPMREIHKIQEELYKEQKKMTDKEKLAALHREAEEAEKKYGFFSEKSFVYEINLEKFNGGPVFLYHPLTPYDMSAFEEFILGEGDYEFIEGAINIIGHDGLLDLLRRR